ncbi:DASH family cryptochrome [Flavobacterium aquatile]|uniref:Cryptochrome DASH n=1 Tax=Flavobacterium aquatile LMG 4008 = ATCC 11947 TaxID=1453498 RepID=A0A095UYT6_9FLAO|nr:DASH family cryptochrome [Flavobacterium aquatile]KGD67735.1 cryptochrome DASH [Flavobacterium aquatile LMG 4008 = ATCC 11947]OXA67598.1 cryptochrome DASH [Flavobacterium aquatile] [Flavobacterium aquatile LMG 4008 = ATCC 11947]GEC78229.1 deoxyribodipyrimidine photo-lyase [Flavobacterium aquatile]
MKTSIIWFKTDLRLHDNETLIKAISQSDEIIPVYCFDDADFVITEFGFKKIGNFRAQFLLQSLIDLDKNLRAIGSGLMILKGKPEVEIPKIVHQYKATKVFSKKEVSYEENQTETKIREELFKLKCELKTFSTSTLYHAEDLPFSIKDIPDVFTNFRKKTEKDAFIRTSFDEPKELKSPEIEPLKLPTLEELGLNFEPIDSRAVLQFKGGETEAISRLNHYFFKTKCISEYKETRNGLVGADYSSKFSAWLALGCISPRFIYDELKKYESQFGANESTYWLVFELLWRDYFRFMMKKYNAKFFQQAGIQDKGIPVNKHNANQLQEWIDGETRVDFVDANMIELKLTGFMSNRGRQNVASYLCNDLKLDWRYGAAYFEEQLIDYDVCSNWGNWAYLAGVGNDPRGNRYFNIEKQASDYDKNKVYRNLWLKS